MSKNIDKSSKGSGKYRSGDEMKSVGVIEDPDVDELKLEDMFIDHKKNDPLKMPNFEFISLVGRSGKGKTRLGMDIARILPDFFVKDLNQRDSKKMNIIYDKGIVDNSTHKLWVLGLEESTEDELYGRSSADHYSNLDIHYSSLIKYSGLKYDYVETYNNFLKYLKKIFVSVQSGHIKGSVLIDSLSPIIQQQNYILRTKIMKVNPTDKEQGIPMRYWFWRNQQIENIMLVLKHMKCHKILNYKVVLGHNPKDGPREESIQWVEKFCYHLCKTRIDMSSQKTTSVNGINFLGQFDKCRNKPTLYKKTFTNMTANKMFLEIYK